MGCFPRTRRHFRSRYSRAHLLRRARCQWLDGGNAETLHWQWPCHSRQRGELIVRRIGIVLSFDVYILHLTSLATVVPRPVLIVSVVCAMRRKSCKKRCYRTYPRRRAQSWRKHTYLVIWSIGCSLQHLSGENSMTVTISVKKKIRSNRSLACGVVPNVVQKGYKRCILVLPNVNSVFLFNESKNWLAMKCLESYKGFSVNMAVKQNTITNGLEYSLVTGNWGDQKKSMQTKAFVSQVLNPHCPTYDVVTRL